MSKHWMDKVWSWDHCFNALALAAGRPELAWDQFQLPFDHQDETGALPDSVTHSEVLYNFVKPPIHGWALRPAAPAPARAAGPRRAGRDLRAAGALDRVLARRPPRPRPARCPTTSTATTAAGTTPPPSTPSGSSRPPTSPRSSSSSCANWPTWPPSSGDADDAAAWTARRRADPRRAARRAVGRRAVRRPSAPQPGGTWTSSQPARPDADRARRPTCPRDVRDRAGRAASQAHLTAYGLATEPPDSPHYHADGYWRGPIWAPVHRARSRTACAAPGTSELADEISARFRALCEKSGFAENFDAADRRGPARPRLHLDRQQLPHPRRRATGTAGWRRGASRDPCAGPTGRGPGAAASGTRCAGRSGPRPGRPALREAGPGQRARHGAGAGAQRDGRAVQAVPGWRHRARRCAPAAEPPPRRPSRASARPRRSAVAGSPLPSAGPRPR